MSLLLFTAGAVQGQFPYFRSIIKSGGIGDQRALAVGAGLDSVTNAYILGTFDTQVSIGNTLNNPSPCTNIFIGKYAFGGLLTSPPTPAWAVAPTIDAPLSDLRFAVHAFGGPVVAGSFEGTNISFGTFSITNAAPSASSDVFLGKFDGDGNAAWLKRFGGGGNDQCGDLAVDLSGNNYLAGSFDSSSFSADETTLTKLSAQGTDCFLIKADSNGNVLSVKQGSYASGSNVALDQVNNCYMAGTFSAGASISGLSPSNPTGNQFVIKYNSGGTALWCRGDMKVGNKLVVDRAQNIISAGAFNGSAAQFQTVTLSNNAPANAFIVKYDNTGNVLWARHIPGGGNDCVNGMYVDSRTNYWVTGTMAPSQDVTQTRMFVACYDSTGTPMGFAKATGNGVSTGNGLSTFMGGFDFLCGAFSGEFKIGNQSLTNNGDFELILARVTPLPPLIKTTRNGNNIVHSWPNPTALGFAPSEPFSLQVSSELNGWNPATNTPALVGGQYVVTNSATESIQLFRLRRP